MAQRCCPASDGTLRGVLRNALHDRYAGKTPWPHASTKNDSESSSPPPLVLQGSTWRSTNAMGMGASRAPAITAGQPGRDRGAA